MTETDLAAYTPYPPCPDCAGYVPMEPYAVNGYTYRCPECGYVDD